VHCAYPRGKAGVSLTPLVERVGVLRLLIEATEADLSQKRERTELADTSYAWLTMLSLLPAANPDRLHFVGLWFPRPRCAPTPVRCGSLALRLNFGT